MSQPIQIAYLSTLYPSIAHTFIEREVRALREQGVEVTTFAVRLPSAADQLSRDHGEAARTTTYLLGDLRGLAASVVLALALRPLDFLRALWASLAASPDGLRSHALHVAYFLEALFLARCLKRAGLRHVHVHFANNGAVVAYLAQVFDSTLHYSLTVHGPLEFFDAQTTRLERKARSARFVRCISNYCRGQTMMWTDPADWDRMFVCHCGIDPSRFPPKPSPPSAPRPADRPLRLMALGRLAPMKAFGVLLEACSRIDFNWHLDLIGDGPLRADLEALADKLGIADRVVFHGAVGQDDIASHFDAADVLVVSSFLEGLPVVLMEGLAKRLPVVATRVAGIPEIVEDGVTGLLVDPADPDALARALTRLEADPDLCERLGRAGREKVLAEFAIDGIAASMREAFERLEGG